MSVKSSHNNYNNNFNNNCSHTGDVNVNNDNTVKLSAREASIVAFKRANPNATYKDIATKFDCHNPEVYKALAKAGMINSTSGGRRKSTIDQALVDKVCAMKRDGATWMQMQVNNGIKQISQMTVRKILHDNDLIGN